MPTPLKNFCESIVAIDINWFLKDELSKEQRYKLAKVLEGRFLEFLQLEAAKEKDANKDY